MKAADPLLDRALQRAYRLLALRPHSERELAVKLSVKGFPPPVVAAVLERLREQNYIDDEAFARQWARHLAMNRLLGDGRIAFELRRKGIDPDRIPQVLQEVRREFPEEAAVAALAGKPSGRNRTGDLKEKRRWVQNLMRRGFAGDAIGAVDPTEREDEVHDDDGQ